jgi:Bacterial SH3 domain
LSLTLSTAIRGQVRALLWACVATLALGWWGPGEVRALDLWGLEPAAAEVRAALDQMAEALDAAPAEVRTTVSADLLLMSQAIAGALDRLEGGPVPIVDPTLVYDLNLLADIAQAATSELRAAARESGASVPAERIETVGALADAAAARLLEVDLVIDGWAERGRGAVVELTEVDGELVLRTTDRLIYDAVRYASIGLLLVGLLLVGLQLLRMSADRIDPRALLRRTPVLSRLAIGALVLFFVGCLAAGLRPGTLATSSAEVLQAEQQPCERLGEQRDRLIAAQQLQHAGLVEATKQRMIPAARDCLGLPTAMATAEAIDLLADRTAMARYEPVQPAPAATAAPTEPPERPGAAAGSVAPAIPELAETTELDALADLLTPYRDPDEPPSGQIDDAAEAPALADRTAAAAPEPAAGPPLPDEAAGAPELVPAIAAAAPAVSDGADRSDPALYVTTTAVNYRAGPSLEARRLGTLVAGARLAVIGENDGWSEIRLQDGREVFVASEFLERTP